MAERQSIPAPRVRELVFALGTAWLLMENLLLLLWMAWQPLTAIRIATLTLLRVAVRAAAPMSELPGGILDVARLLAAAGTGVPHV